MICSLNIYLKGYFLKTIILTFWASIGAPVLVLALGTINGGEGGQLQTNLRG